MNAPRILNLPKPNTTNHQNNSVCLTTTHPERAPLVTKKVDGAPTKTKRMSDALVEQAPSSPSKDAEENQKQKNKETRDYKQVQPEAHVAAAPPVDDPRWENILQKVPKIMQTIKNETERAILGEAQFATKVDGWKCMEEAVQEHSCIGFVWFRSKVPSVWCHNQRPRLEKMIDTILPGANWQIIGHGDGTADFCLLLPPPTNDEHRGFLALTVESWGAWVWDSSQQRRRPVPVVAS